MKNASPAMLARPAAVWTAFALLVAIGVVGRWGQTEWSVTPLAAVGLLAGYALPSTRLAVAAPLAALAVSNLALTPYQTPAVGLAVYGSMAVAPLLGRLLRRPLASRSAGAARLAALGALPSVVFFVVTNFAVWASQSLYPKTAAGIAECYVAALPFFRPMLVGDLAYTAVLFGVAGLAGAYSLTGLTNGVATAGETRSNAV